MSGDSPSLRNFHETLSCNLEIAFFTMFRIALQTLATSTANLFRFRKLDLWNVTALCFTLTYQRAICRDSAYPHSSRIKQGREVMSRLQYAFRSLLRCTINRRRRCQTDWCTQRRRMIEVEHILQRIGKLVAACEVQTNVVNRQKPTLDHRQQRRVIADAVRNVAWFRER